METSNDFTLGLSALLLAGLFCAFCVIGAEAQSGGENANHPLEIEVDRLKRDIADLAKLENYAERLEALAKSDPVSARRARAAISTCTETPLAPWCDLLTGLFRAERVQ